MPRIANTTDALLTDLTRRLEQLVETARKEGREDALAELRSVLGGSAPAKRSGRKPAKATRKPRAKKAAKLTKSGRKRKNPWATMTTEQKAERVRKMLAGRGLKPKSERGAAKPVAAKKKTTRKRTARKRTAGKKTAGKKTTKRSTKKS